MAVIQCLRGSTAEGGGELYREHRGDELGCTDAEVDQEELNPFLPEKRLLWTHTGMEGRRDVPRFTESIAVSVNPVR